MVYEFWPSVLFSSIFGMVLITLQFILPVIILVYCYGRIVWILTRRIDSNLQTSDKQTDKFMLARKNTIKTFLLVGLFFIICWSNNEVYYLMYNLGYNADWNGNYFQFTVLMVFLNCTVNPFIYLVKYRDYQSALKRLVGCERKREDKCEGKHSVVTVSDSCSYLKSHQPLDERKVTQCRWLIL